MGAVKVDIHKNFNKWNSITFSDELTIKGLLKNRIYYDELYSSKITGVADYHNFIEDVFLLYLDLDRLIKRCNFRKEQIIAIDMLQQGYIEKEIGERLGITQESVNSMLSTISKSIVSENNWNYLKNVYKNIFELKTIKCTSCKEDLPVIDDFFYVDSKNMRTGIRHTCKRCISKNNKK